MPKPAFILELQQENANKTGRKKKYSDKYLEQLARDLLTWIKGDDNFYLKEFAVINGFSAQRISEFAKENEKFKEAYEIAKDWQDVKFIKGMTKRGNNPAGWIFAGKNVCGMRDRQDNEDKDLTDEERNKLKSFIQQLRQANV